MNAATLSPVETAREAHAVLHLAMAMPSCDALDAVMVALDDALDTYAELDGNGLHWENVYPHLRDEADPDGEALRKAAEEVDAAAGDLIEVMAAHSGTEDETKNAAGSK